VKPAHVLWDHISKSRCRYRESTTDRMKISILNSSLRSSGGPSRLSQMISRIRRPLDFFSGKEDARDGEGEGTSAA
jgi:hypothetical protein